MSCWEKWKAAGGDRQFRIYVSLKPGALEILEKSNEFDRKADNTSFTKDFQSVIAAPVAPLQSSFR